MVNLVFGNATFCCNYTFVGGCFLYSILLKLRFMVVFSDDTFLQFASCSDCPFGQLPRVFYGVNVANSLKPRKTVIFVCDKEYSNAPYFVARCRKCTLYHQAPFFKMWQQLNTHLYFDCLMASFTIQWHPLCSWFRLQTTLGHEPSPEGSLDGTASPDVVVRMHIYRPKSGMLLRQKSISAKYYIIVI